MAGRNHIPRHALMEDPRLLHRIPRPSAAATATATVTAGGRPHPALIEEHIAARQREIQSLLLDNQRLAAGHVALKQELAAVHQELRHLSAAAGNIKAERDAEVREVYERSLKMEADVRSVNASGAELSQLRMDVQKLTAAKQELSAEMQAIDRDLAKVRTEGKETAAIKEEIGTMHQELQRGRAAIEYEKKTYAYNLEQSQAMEKNMFTMAREIEKLHAELADAEKRARAAAAAAANPSPGYGANYGNGAMGYGGNLYPNPYNMQQVQGVTEGSPYGSGAVPQGPYLQQTPVQQQHPSS